MLSVEECANRLVRLANIVPSADVIVVHGASLTRNCIQDPVFISILGKHGLIAKDESGYFRFTRGRDSCESIEYNNCLFQPISKFNIHIKLNIDNGYMITMWNSTEAYQNRIYGYVTSWATVTPSWWTADSEIVPEFQSLILDAAFGKDWPNYITFTLTKRVTTTVETTIQLEHKVKLF